jgi:hypothetical protein
MQDLTVLDKKKHIKTKTIAPNIARVMVGLKKKKDGYQFMAYKFWKRETRK